MAHHDGLQSVPKELSIAQVYTGYVEFTAGGWTNYKQDGRIVYDYALNQLFLTPNHYRPFKKKAREGYDRDVRADDPHAQSPFYYIE